MGFEPKAFLANAARRMPPPELGFGVWGTTAVYVFANEAGLVEFLELGGTKRSLPLGDFMANGWRHSRVQRGEVATVEEFLGGVARARSLPVELRLQVLQGLTAYLSPEEQSLWRDVFSKMDEPKEVPNE